MIAVSKPVSRQRRAQQRGNSTLETGLVLIVLTMISLGIIEFGRAVWIYNTLSHASRAALRYTLVRGTENPASDADITAVVYQNTPGLVPTDLQVQTTFNPDRTRGSRVTVQITYPFRFVVSPSLDANQAMTLNLRSTSVGIIDQ